MAAINLAFQFSFSLLKLSETNSAKITEVGVSKGAEDITGPLTRTPVYMAPEVFHSRLYDSKADIYSLEILMWEMWYRRQAFCEVDYRPPTIEAFFAWVEIVRNSWKDAINPQAAGKP